MEGMAGGFGMIFFLFMALLVILWILMPFAIFGTKDRLDTLITEVRKQNSLLTEMRDNLKKAG